MAACWDYEHRDQDRPVGLITHTYRKLNDLTRHLKFIIRSVTGQRQSIFKKLTLLLLMMYCLLS